MILSNLFQHACRTPDIYKMFLPLLNPQDSVVVDHPQVFEIISE